MPLQKSFSEQNGSLKTRQHWHKSKSHSAVNQSSAASNARRPLQPVSEVTKTKLNAFNFRSPIQEPEANGPIKRKLVDENDNAVKHNALSSVPPKETSQLALLPDPIKSVSTPVSRLAWQDLIGDSDIKAEDDDTSPREKIGWDTKQQPMYGVSPMPRKRGSKRARSSSPMSSPAPCSKSTTPAVNVKELSAALKSPRADPAIELWDRFSLSGSTTATPLGATNPALAQILVSSSPQPSRSVGAGQGEGGLRRAISCGANWPKRRRVERTETVPPMNVAVGESPSGNSKSSMVSALLKTVTGEINRSKAAQTQLDVLKSPSPRKRRYNPADQLSGSPKQRPSSSKSTPPLFPGAVEVSKEAGTVDNSSDYGDDDFDDDTLMGLDAGISPALEYESRIPQPQTPVPKQSGNPNTTAQYVGTADDEFTDLDDDIFADAGELLSQIDSVCNAGQHTTTSQDPIPVNPDPQGTIIDDLADDMYGDDFGDFDFEAAEIAATQSAKKPNGSVPLVLAISEA
ncbi:hypothetical protein HD806DRAFT_213229 [Xylariaceae sp. AK1471]|nr:hypothetical protein HD806DRAFT_213229 [Xylariaceae sp. AK1471]